MAYPQTGILALGTLSHAYLEFDRRAGVDAAALVAAARQVAAVHATVTGVNLVVGFRPELWAAHAPSAAPDGVTGFAAGRRAGRVHDARHSHRAGRAADVDGAVACGSWPPRPRSCSTSTAR